MAVAGDIISKWNSRYDNSSDSLSPPADVLGHGERWLPGFYSGREKQTVLKPGGILFYQTFTHGLSNPDYLLRSNELPSLFENLSILEYHESEPDESGRAEARLIACCPDISATS